MIEAAQNEHAGPNVAGPVVARDLYRDALDCVEREEFRRAQTKLRRALAHDPAFTAARRALDRLIL